MASSPVSSPAVDVRRPDGTVVASRALDAQTFGIKPNVPVMHQVVTAQLAAARSGTQSTKTRAEVNGGGAKPWRQKGTGRARQGSSRAPHWAGGGVALGPKPRSYKQKTPKKMVALALRSALSDRAAQGRVAVVESWGIEQARTKDALGLLAALGIGDGKVLVVVAPEDHVATLSFRNLPHVHVLAAAELNAYDVLCADWVVFSAATLPGGLGDGTSAAAPAQAAQPAPAEAAQPAQAAQPAPAQAAEVAETDAAGAEKESSE
ncbi:MAG TPA: 50S ribosomal protein L4 [Acidimicrobiales bacterium]|nr:50S ribosomal protein L4 [Acidimicrobiales bacterium]